MGNAGQGRKIGNAGQSRKIGNAGQGREMGNAGQGREMHLLSNSFVCFYSQRIINSPLAKHKRTTVNLINMQDIQ
jgi:hypothetical protein